MRDHDRQSRRSGRARLQRVRLRRRTAEDRADPECSFALYGNAGCERVRPSRAGEACARLWSRRTTARCCLRGIWRRSRSASTPAWRATGPVYRLAFSAVSDEWLLDKQSTPPGGTGLAQTGGELLRTLTSRVDAGRFVTDAVDDRAPWGSSRLRRLRRGRPTRARSQMRPTPRTACWTEP